ncbi:MAG: nucleotidyltransferase domain-containing protein [Bacteroidetes bacterium]|nr:MAG: nucleotidyltransferase domain-containing protein [Bacteroidota bacterium]
MNNSKYIKEITKKLETINPYLIILFGSYAYGTANEDSDIDILVVTNDNFIPKDFDDRLKYRLSIKRIIRETAKKVPIDLLIYSKPMFKKFIELDSSFSKEILTNGKKLYESNNTRLA